MWLASHMVSGGLIYDAVRSERPWLRWMLFVIAAYIFHVVLDSTPVFHDMDWPWKWWQWGIAAYNAATATVFLWQFDHPSPWSKWLRKVFLTRLLVGGFAWLSMDAFWLYRPWGEAVHSLFPNIGRWPDPRSAVLELAFMGLVTVLAFRGITKRQAARRAGKKGMARG